MDKQVKRKVKGSEALFAGFDVGSSFVHYAVLTEDKEIIYSPKPIMHFADPIAAVKEAWSDIIGKYGSGQIKNTSFTGSGAESFPKVMEGITYTFDSVAIPKGAETAQPQAQYIFHLGAKDSYFFNLKQIDGKKIIQEWKTGTKCGGGSGTLIEKQCRRLFEGQVTAPELEDIATAKDETQKEDIRIKNRQKQQERLEEMFYRAQKEAEQSNSQNSRVSCWRDVESLFSLI
jgi:activator of 2-hydroxyglutaryl-CoA dehydratase